MKDHIRKIFAVFSLVMLGLMIWRVSGGVWTTVNWGMFAIAALSCLLIFKNFVYVFNYSYGLCVALNAALIWYVMPTPVSALMGAVAFTYGVRLFLFTWNRMHSESYGEKYAGIQKADSYVPKPVKFSLWVQCTMLHTFHLMGLWFVAGKGVINSVVLVGIAVMLAGTLIEAIADSQKQIAKSQDSTALVTNGLFARWRHPNYAGEILFHVGIIIAGLASVSSAADAIVVLVAPLYIMLLMITEASRVDGVHVEKYGETKAYPEYRANSGSLIPKF